MCELKKFIDSNSENILTSTKLPSKETINEAEKLLNTSFGDELKSYFKNYGFVSYKFIELYGLNETQKMKSDIVLQTINIKKLFDISDEMIIIEDMGDGDYILCDSKDNMYSFIPSLEKKIKPLNLTLNKYIVERFKSID